jgi:hypothetical protein
LGLVQLDEDPVSRTELCLVQLDEDPVSRTELCLVQLDEDPVSRTGLGLVQLDEDPVSRLFTSLGLFLISHFGRGGKFLADVWLMYLIFFGEQIFVVGENKAFAILLRVVS